MPGMNILALETSTESGSCALLIGDAVVERRCPPGRPHSETLLPLIRELLAESGLVFKQLDAVAFGAGPGAFTGLRVACGVAQGLAVGAGLPVVPVCGLEAMAATVDAPRVVSLLDARMGEVYAAAYTLGDDGYALHGRIHVGAPEAIELPAGSGWLAAGNALTAYPLLGERLQAAGFILQPGVLPQAAAVARLAARRPMAQIDPALAAPLYIRDKVAKTIVERLGEGGRA